MSNTPASQSSTSALEALKQASDRSVLVIGDVMLDRFQYGAVDRVSPEAPIPIFTFEHEESMLGGAGNVVRNLLALGARSTFLSVIGDDATGKRLLTLVAQENQLVPYLLPERERISTEKTRFVSGTQQLLRADHETRAPISASTEAKLTEIVSSEIEQHQAVILSDYGKGVLTPKLVRAAIDAAKGAGVPVFVDPKQRDLSLYSGATVISPNAKEFLLAAGRDQWDDATFLSDATRLIKVHDIQALLVTRGAAGMSLITKDGVHTHIPAQARDVFDVSGAGDTAIATLALAVACGIGLADAVGMANLAAGIVVGRLGTAVVHHTDLTTALHAQHSLEMHEKILTLPLACDAVANWKREGLTVGFTNGCFDIMHAGHVTLLNDARAQCDRLVVGVNSDASVKRLKGESRPVNAEDDRALLLAAIRSVDAVVIFGEDTPLELLSALKPDVLMKGADYTKATVVGAELVESYGGRIVLLALKDGYSTTGIIKKAAVGS